MPFLGQRYAAPVSDAHEPRPQRTLPETAVMHRQLRHRRPDHARGRSASRLSWMSFGSLLCVGSGLSVIAILSLGSAGSILSIGSTGSILSIGSAGSILSIGSAGSILSIGGAGTLLNRRRDRKPEPKGV